MITAYVPRHSNEAEPETTYIDSEPSKIYIDADKTAVIEKKDVVHHPGHYADKQIEVIDYIRDTLTPVGCTDYCLGNVLKYVSRWRKKGGIQDLCKAQVYLEWAIECAKKEGQPC